MTVDVKSYELASHFLSDYSDAQIPDIETRGTLTQKLAEAIQATIEEWLAETMIPF